jgi:tripartite-type tricarboxylate transporter receptor subunit TctC
MEFMARAPNDGYTLYYFDSGPLTVAPHLSKVGYNNLSSFTQLGHVCGSGSLLVVHPSTPFRSVQDVWPFEKRPEQVELRHLGRRRPAPSLRRILQERDRRAAPALCPTREAARR